jgi:glycine hydroxymethyltransferase
MHVIAAKAVALREAMQPSFADYARQVVANAHALASALAERGYHIVSGGTDNHLMLVDLRNKGITGKDAERALGMAEITVNKNTVPGETQSPFVTSGVRIGTPALTTRGMREEEMRRVAELIDRVLARAGDEAVAARVRAEVHELASRYPLHAGSAPPAAVL